MLRKFFVSISLFLCMCPSKGQNIFNADWVNVIDKLDDSYNSFEEMVADKSGNVYLGLRTTTSFQIEGSTYGIEYAPYIFKFMSNGQLEWQRTFRHGSDFYKLDFYTLTVANNDDILITGTFEDYLYNDETDTLLLGNDGANSFILRMNADGEILSHVIFEDTMYFTRTETDTDGNIYFLAKLYGSQNFVNGILQDGNIVICKLDTNYIFQWVNAFDVQYAPGSSISYADLSIEPQSGKIAFAATYSDTSKFFGETFIPFSYYYYHEDSFWYDYDSVIYYTDTIFLQTPASVVAQYNLSGEMEWRRSIHGDSYNFGYSINSGGDNGVFFGTKYDPYGSHYIDSILFLQGQTDPPSSHTYTLLRLDNEGNYITHLLGNDTVEYFFDVYYKNDLIYVPGTYYDNDYYTYDEAFIATYNEDLIQQEIAFATCFNPYAGSSNFEELAFSDSSIFFLGQYEYCAVIGDIVLDTLLNSAFIFGKLDTDFAVPYITPDSLQYITTHAVTYPVPSRDKIYMSFLDSLLQIENLRVIDELGKMHPVSFEVINKNTILLDIAHLHPGIYFVLIESETYLPRTFKFIKN